LSKIVISTWSRTYHFLVCIGLFVNSNNSSLNISWSWSESCSRKWFLFLFIEASISSFILSRTGCTIAILRRSKNILWLFLCSDPHSSVIVKCSNFLIIIPQRLWWHVILIPKLRWKAKFFWKWIKLLCFRSINTRLGNVEAVGNSYWHFINILKI
jgi:hypothetical protein